MVKKSFLLFILLIFIFLTSGCTVVRGTNSVVCGLVQGTKEGACRVQEGIKQGAEEDWTALQKTDAWIRENLW